MSLDVTLANPVHRLPKPAPHGTNAAWHRHWRRGEVACEACAAAHAEYERARRWNRATRAAASGESRRRNIAQTAQAAVSVREAVSA